MTRMGRNHRVMSVNKSDQISAKGTKRWTESASGKGAGRKLDDQDGMHILSLLLAGISFYGFIGWLGDQYFDTVWLLPSGAIVGLIFSCYLIFKRYGSGA